MTTVHDTHAEEAAVRVAIEGVVQAVRERDVEWLLALCASDVVVYDMIAPLEHRGTEALRAVWDRTLSGFEGPVEYAFQGLAVEVSGDVALARGLARFGGKRDGRRVVNWLRSTFGLRKQDGRWRLVHQHVSVPVDMQSGKALLELEP